MKKILSILLTMLVAVSVTACSSSSDSSTSNDQEKVVAEYYTDLSEGKLDALEKLTTEDFNETSFDSMKQSFENVSDKNIYGKDFVAAVEEFKTKVYESVVKDYKFGKTIKNNDDSVTIEVTGNMMNLNDFSIYNTAEINTKLEKYLADNKEELDKVLSEKGSGEMSKKVYTALKDDYIKSYEGILDACTYNKFAKEFTLVKSGKTWLISNIETK